MASPEQRLLELKRSELLLIRLSQAQAFNTCAVGLPLGSLRPLCRCRSLLGSTGSNNAALNCAAGVVKSVRSPVESIRTLQCSAENAGAAGASEFLVWALTNVCLHSSRMTSAFSLRAHVKSSVGNRAP